jgi:hypothetical protein
MPWFIIDYMFEQLYDTDPLLAKVHFTHTTFVDIVDNLLMFVLPTNIGQTQPTVVQYQLHLLNSFMIQLLCSLNMSICGTLIYTRNLMWYTINYIF